MSELLARTKHTEILDKVYQQGFADAMNGVYLENILVQSDTVFESFIELKKIYLQALGVDPEGKDSVELFDRIKKSRAEKLLSYKIKEKDV